MRVLFKVVAGGIKIVMRAGRIATDACIALCCVQTQYVLGCWCPGAAGMGRAVYILKSLLTTDRIVTNANGLGCAIFDPESPVAVPSNPATDVIVQDLSGGNARSCCRCRSATTGCVDGGALPNGSGCCCGQTANPCEYRLVSYTSYGWHNDWYVGQSGSTTPYYSEITITLRAPTAWTPIQSNTGATAILDYDYHRFGRQDGHDFDERSSRAINRQVYCRCGLMSYVDNATGTVLAQVPTMLSFANSQTSGGVPWTPLFTLFDGGWFSQYATDWSPKPLTQCLRGGSYSGGGSYTYTTSGRTFTGYFTVQATWEFRCLNQAAGSPCSDCAPIFALMNQRDQVATLNQLIAERRDV